VPLCLCAAPGRVGGPVRLVVLDAFVCAPLSGNLKPTLVGVPCVSCLSSFLTRRVHGLCVAYFIFQNLSSRVRFYVCVAEMSKKNRDKENSRALES
jgi:hypothetical protein